jgi:hypothetical protein
MRIGSSSSDSSSYYSAEYSDSNSIDQQNNVNDFFDFVNGRLNENSLQPSLQECFDYFTSPKNLKDDIENLTQKIQYTAEEHDSKTYDEVGFSSALDMIEIISDANINSFHMLYQNNEITNNLILTLDLKSWKRSTPKTLHSISDWNDGTTEVSSPYSIEGHTFYIGSIDEKRYGKISYNFLFRYNIHLIFRPKDNCFCKSNWTHVNEDIALIIIDMLSFSLLNADQLDQQWITSNHIYISNQFDTTSFIDSNLTHSPKTLTLNQFFSKNFQLLLAHPRYRRIPFFNTHNYYFMISGYGMNIKMDDNLHQVFDVFNPCYISAMAWASAVNIQSKTIEPFSICIPTSNINSIFPGNNFTTYSKAFNETFFSNFKGTGNREEIISWINRENEINFRLARNPLAAITQDNELIDGVIIRDPLNVLCYHDLANLLRPTSNADPFMHLYLTKHFSEHWGSKQKRNLLACFLNDFNRVEDMVQTRSSQNNSYRIETIFKMVKHNISRDDEERRSANQARFIQCFLSLNKHYVDDTVKILLDNSIRVPSRIFPGIIHCNNKILRILIENSIQSYLQDRLPGGLEVEFASFIERLLAFNINGDRGFLSHKIFNSSLRGGLNTRKSIQLYGN